MPNELIPTEQNDRLLELAGGCRHEWVDVPRSWREHNWTVRECAKCNAPRYLIPDDWDDGYPESWEPAVGDGHAMDLGEMVRLAHRLFPGCEVCLKDSYVGLFHRGVEYGRSLDSPDETDFALGGVILQHAILAGIKPAIIAAVDGAKA